jgi:hypothetical protein
VGIAGRNRQRYGRDRRRHANRARNYEAQETTDLTGATGWESAEEMPSATKLSFEGLTSGTKYAFRVRAWGNGMPGPWSTPVQQMAP